MTNVTSYYKNLIWEQMYCTTVEKWKAEATPGTQDRWKEGRKEGNNHILDRYQFFLSLFLQALLSLLCLPDFMPV